MSFYKITVHRGEESSLLCAEDNKSILESLGTAYGVDAPCGGRGVCGKCRVELKGLLRSFDSGEIIDARGEYSACRYAPAGDCEVWLRPDTAEILGAEAKIQGGGEGIGLAIDVGTTTIAAAVYDLKTGQCIAEKTELNAQRSFGADVISRMEYCRHGKTNELFAVTENQLSGLWPEREKISHVALVGNTVMEHFAAGLNPSDMAVPPFTPQSLFGGHVKSDIWPMADVYFAPCVSAYVGGDVTAGMLACGLNKSDETVLYVDIGTNGEIALGNKEGYLTCATAAGPAFEGAEIDCGMNAAKGAIDRVWTENGEVFTHVIGEGEAKGICGSGLIDTVAVLLNLKLISKSGRFISKEKAPETLRERFCERDGARAFLLRDGVYISARDVHRLQLAKAAIRAGIELMLRNREISRLIVAGGFGKFINTENAVKIGLLPGIPAEKITQAGNAAAKGAALLLDAESEEALRELTAKCSYVDLSSSKEFSDKFIENLNF